MMVALLGKMDEVIGLPSIDRPAINALASQMLNPTDFDKKNFPLDLYSARRGLATH